MRSTRAGRPQGHRPRLRWVGSRADRADDQQRPAAGSRAAGQQRRLRAARHHHPAAEPGRVVHIHHRARPRRPRHLRLRAPRSEDDAALPLHDPDRSVGADHRPRPVAAAAVERARGAAAAGTALLGAARRARRADDDHPHAGELPAVGDGHPRAQRHGHTGSARHVRHVLVLHLGTIRLRGPDAVGRRGLQRTRRARARARIAGGPGQPVPPCTREGEGRVHRLSRRIKSVRQDRRGERGASTGGRRVERLGAGAVRSRADADARRRSALLPQGARSVLRALCEPGKHRSAGASDAGVDPARVRGRARRGYRPFLYAGDARGHERPEDRGADRRRVPGAGNDRRRREPRAIPLRAGPFP